MVSSRCVWMNFVSHRESGGPPALTLSSISRTRVRRVQMSLTPLQ